MLPDNKGKVKRAFHFVLFLFVATAALGNIPNSRFLCTFDAAGTNVFEYYHADHLRSTSILTDRNGNRIQHHEYSAYGRDRYTESSTAFPVSRRYTSQVLDEDTGLYFYGARYYDPQVGRFIQPDTVIPSVSNPQHLNPYSYCLNNPLRYTDPSGHAPEDDEDDIPLSYGQAHAASRQAQSGASAQLYNKSTADMQSMAAGGRAMAELHPVAGAVNAGYQLGTRSDAMDYHQLTTKEQVWSGVDLGLQGSGKVLKAGAAIGTAVYIKRAARIADEANDVRKVAKAIGSVPAGGVYVLVDRTTGKIMRSGRSNDLARRAGEHARDAALGKFDFRVVYQTDKYAEQRGLAQMVHETYRPPLNQINPVSAFNPRKGQYKSAAQEFLKRGDR